MVKPDRTLIAYQRENPVYLFMQKLEKECGNRLFSLNDIGISYKEYISYITFEMIAEKYENESKKVSLRQHQKNIIKKDTEYCSPADILDREKVRSKDLQLRRQFRDAKLKRFHIVDLPQYEQLRHGMKDRKAPKEGYDLTKIQSFQLEDKEDLRITKTFNLTRFADSSNVKGNEIKDYYADLAKTSTKRSDVSNLEDRITYAINLNKFENENLFDISYRIARYCVDHRIRIVAAEMENLLLAITGAICCGSVKIFRKPVLLIEKLLPYMFNKSANDPSVPIANYVNLQIQGLQLRRDPVLKEALSSIEFTLEDFWEFIWYDYNVFSLYQDIRWDGKGQTISALRKIVKIVAIKPLD